MTYPDIDRAQRADGLLCRHDFVQPSYGAKFVCVHCGEETIAYRGGRTYTPYRGDAPKWARWQERRDARRENRR